MRVDDTCRLLEIDQVPEQRIVGYVLVESPNVVSQSPDFLSYFIAKNRLDSVRYGENSDRQIDEILRFLTALPDLLLLGIKRI